ncbi:hypothetical protein LSAT2_009646, partial [Lamellibrachia satsuma]
RQRGRRRRETNNGSADSCSNQDIRSNHHHSGGAHIRTQRQHRAAESSRARGKTRGFI